MSLRTPTSNDEKDEVARRRASEVLDKLMEEIYYACRRWIVKNRRPRLDKPDEIRQRAHLYVSAMVDVFRAQVALHDLTVSELGARMGWREGRAEDLFAHPTAFRVEDAERICLELDLTMPRVLELAELRWEDDDIN